MCASCWSFSLVYITIHDSENAKFEENYQSHIQDSSSPTRAIGLLDLEGGTNILSRKFSNKITNHVT